MSLMDTATEDEIKTVNKCSRMNHFQLFDLKTTNPLSVLENDWRLKLQSFLEKKYKKTDSSVIKFSTRVIVDTRGK